MEHAVDIRMLREALGWNQSQLGAYCGVDRSTVSKWEKEPPLKGPALILLKQLQARVAEAVPAVSPDAEVRA